MKKKDDDKLGKYGRGIFQATIPDFSYRHEVKRCIWQWLLTTAFDTFLMLQMFPSEQSGQAVIYISTTLKKVMLLTSSDQRRKTALAYTTILIVRNEHVFTCAQLLPSE